jgi:hypothetical protein
LPYPTRPVRRLMKSATCLTTNDGASEAINKLIDVGFSYDEAITKVDQYNFLQAILPP